VKETGPPFPSSLQIPPETPYPPCITPRMLMWCQVALSRDKERGLEAQTSFMDTWEMNFQCRRVCEKQGEVRGGWLSC